MSESARQGCCKNEVEPLCDALMEALHLRCRHVYHLLAQLAYTRPQQLFIVVVQHFNKYIDK